MKLSAVEIIPGDDATIRIAGLNGAGKSAVLNAIESAFGGAEVFPEGAVKEGAERADILVETDDLVVKRHITAKNHSLKVTNRHDAKIVYSSPQEMLSALFGKISFDPAAFQRMRPELQRETLQKLLGLDFAPLDAKYKELYDNRTAVGRTLKDAQGAVATLPPLHAGVPAAEQSIAELSARLTKARTANKQCADTQAKLKTLDTEMAHLESQEASLLEQLEICRQSMAAKQTDLDTIKTVADLLQPVDEAPIIAAMTSSEGTNAKIRANAQRRAAEAAVGKHEESYTLHSTALATIEDQKKQMIATAKFPIKGLSFSEKGVLYNSKPFADASTAEQIRVSVAMGMAMNPNLKVILIRDASLLDKLSFAVIEEMAKANGYQIWMEVVTNGPEEEKGCQVVIVDGSVKE